MQNLTMEQEPSDIVGFKAMPIKKPLKSSVLSALFGCVLGVGLTMVYYSLFDKGDAGSEVSQVGNAGMPTDEVLDSVAMDAGVLRMVFEEWLQKESECSASTVDELVEIMDSPSSLNRGMAASSLSQYCGKFQERLIPEIIGRAKKATTAREILSMILALNRLKPESSKPVHAFFQSLDESDSRYALYMHAKASYEENLRISNNNPAMTPW